MSRPPSQNPAQPQFGISVPNYVRVQLRAMAAREGLSVRYLVLKGLLSIGVHVDPADLVEDRRKRRPKRKHYAGTPRIKSDERRRLPD